MYYNVIISFSKCSSAFSKVRETSLNLYIYVTKWVLTPCLEHWSPRPWAAVFTSQPQNEAIGRVPVHPVIHGHYSLEGTSLHHDTMREQEQHTKHCEIYSICLAAYN